jgi:hypothetical protein
MSSLPGGPAFTVLRVGDTGVEGVVHVCIPNQWVPGYWGRVVACGKFRPDLPLVRSPLDCGWFIFNGPLFLEKGNRVTFDIGVDTAARIAARNEPIAVNVQKI